MLHTDWMDGMCCFDVPRIGLLYPTQAGLVWAEEKQVQRPPPQIRGPSSLHPAVLIAKRNLNEENNLVSTFCEYIELLTEGVQRYDASRPAGGHWMGL
jgi:hypothetical protein